MVKLHPLPHDTIEARRQRIRDVWKYKKVPHIPMMISVARNRFGTTFREEFESMEKQLELRVDWINESIATVPDDYIPTMFPNIGCVAIASAFGAEISLGGDPEQTPAVKKGVIRPDQDLRELRRPDSLDAGLLPRVYERIRFFVNETRGEVPVALNDMNGVTGCTMDLIGSTRFFTSMTDDPEGLRHAFDVVTETILEVTDRCIEAAGGIDRIASTDFFWEWCPEGRKGHVSDDLSALYPPEVFRDLTRPFHNRIFQRYGGGLLHNCGPNPCLGEYLDHDPPIAGVNLAWDYSRGDLAAFREAFRGRGIIYFNMTGDARTVVEDWRTIMETLAPDTIAIPEYAITDDTDPGEFYRAMLEISREYASRVFGP